MGNNLTPLNVFWAAGISFVPKTIFSPTKFSLAKKLCKEKETNGFPKCENFKVPAFSLWRSIESSNAALKKP